MARLSPVVLACVVVTAVSGCQLYFDSDDDQWGGGDCGPYEDCGYTPPPPPPDAGGYYCTTDYDCAGGCYCGDDGICAEAGYCVGDWECASGFHCDEDRASCVPDDGGSCAGPVVCTVVAPSCPQGSVPEIKDGCYTYDCLAIASCEVPPACESLTYEADCLAAAGCGGVYTGINCTNPDGSACQGGADCDCESFSFNSCETAGPNGTTMRVIVPAGATGDSAGVSTR
ncbi:MAG: hypothetical protein AB7O24_10945 [Kofleriaceae bacterium]